MNTKASSVQPAMTPQQRELALGKSGFAAYRELSVGGSSLFYLCGYELYLLFCSNIPGLLGYGLRSAVAPWLFEKCGTRPALGRGVVLRNPGSISLGNKCMIDDYAVLDAHGVDAGIQMSDFVSVGRYSTLAAKSGRITIGSAVNIGSYCRIATQSKIKIEESVLIAAYAYIGPGNHQESSDDTPLIARDMDIRGGVSIGAHAWIGTRATILDGVTIGESAIIGAHSLVKDNVAPRTIVAGSPARVIGEVSSR